MSVQTIILYGNRLYDVVTYSTNQDPQSFSATLSDTATLSDSEVQNGNKALSDSATLADVQIVTTGIKGLSDTSTLAEILSFVQNSIRSMSDVLQIDDNKVSIQQIKGFSEFIRVKDWLELHLDKVGVWTSSPAFGTHPSRIHLYGPNVFYGVDFYSSNPTVNWLPITPNVTSWSSLPAEIPEIPLYGAVLYGQKTFGSKPSVAWTNPIPTGRQNWTNANGESHN